MKPEVKLIATITGHSAAVLSLACAGRNSFYSGSADRFLAEWNLETFEQEKFAVKSDASVYSILRIEQYNLLLIGLSDGSIHVVDLYDKKEIRHLKQHRQGVFSMKYSEEKNQLFTSDAQGYFCVWELPSFNLILTLPVCEDKIRKMAIRPAGNEIALACGDGKLRILEMEFFNEIHTIASHDLGVNSLLFKNENILVSGGKDAWLKFYDIQNNYAEVNGIPAHNYAIYDIVLSSDHKYYATVSRDKHIKLWNAEKDKIEWRLDRKTFNGHIHSVNTALWHNEKNLLITGSDDRTIKVWRID